MPLVRLLSNNHKGIRKESAWALSNITAGTPEQIQAAIDAGAVSVLVQCLSDEDFAVRKVHGPADAPSFRACLTCLGWQEALWAVANITAGGTPVQIA